MRTAQVLFTALIGVVMIGRSEQQRPEGLPTDENAIAYFQRAEGLLLSELRKGTPLVEAYFQRFEPAKDRGMVPTHDYYMLGRFTSANPPKLDNLIAQDSNAAVQQALLDGIVRTMVPDWQLLTADRYEFQFVRVDFLGALRCLLYDVKPRQASEDSFRGRIYLEDKTWNIVRFTGMIPRVNAALAELRSANSTFRVDTWRVNATKHHWVSAYAYIEEVPPFETTATPITKGQIRFWGYQNDGAPQQGASVDVRLAPSASARQDTTRGWVPPPQSNRVFETEAERNVLDRLTQGNFLGASGDVEAMLDQVITNLVVTNHIALAAPVHCRVLLTTPVEMFTVGNTIVISRGLIDVLPSESALALMLAHQLSHNILGHQKMDTRLAFSDVLRISDLELLAKLRFQHTSEEESAADALAMKLLDQSPYKSTMEDGSLFLQAVQESAPRLTRLIQPHFGEHLADVKRIVANDPNTRTTPVINHRLVDQVAALPLGSKLILNPWNGQVALLTAEPLAALALRERNGLGINAFTPFLEYVTDKPTAAQARSSPAPRTASKTRVGPGSTPRPKPTTAPTVRVPTVQGTAPSDGKKKPAAARTVDQLAARR
jgi:hypothetical protein